MNLAAIDIGTNTIVFLVAEVADGKLRALHEASAMVRLGEGLDRAGRLDPAAIRRSLEALAQVVEIARRLGASRLGAVGTQALREAQNGGEFLVRAREILGGEVEVITAEREARLAWRAVASAFPLALSARRTVLDIGGGSTEIIVGGDRPARLASLPIGSVRLSERWLKHDPPTADEQRALSEAVDRALDAAPVPEGELVGIAGTVTTLAAVHLGLADYRGEVVHGARLGRDGVARLVERLGNLSLAERRRLPGLPSGRADIIYAGGVILSRVLARSPAASVLISDRGIRWGLAEELAGFPDGSG